LGNGSNIAKWRRSQNRYDLQACVWDQHEQELRDSGNLFYTWGYDIRWAGQWLRDNEYLLPKEACKRGVWVATSKGKNHTPAAAIA
jgi:hypothetical protein